ncbi:GTP-binding protein [Longispora fulva]|uniref:G3E family GTPase n=1 Tax=Longispora fulva TaxID=619741 RepID=A0A8J7KZT2_9ACTN|nr:GTP-binding protein [Longispora fulva]MBG6141632.1 G3E family GTPase [Longispora fulva]
MTPETDSPRAPVTLLAGLRSRATVAVSALLTDADPELLVVTHDLTDAAGGVVRRIVHDAAGLVEVESVPVRDGCVACTVRETGPAALARLAAAHPGRPLLLALPEAVEPELIAPAIAAWGRVPAGPPARGPAADRAAHGPARGASLAGDDASGAPGAVGLVVRSVIAAVDPELLLADLGTTDDLADHGLSTGHNDHRTVAEVVARQVEYADTVVLLAAPDAPDDLVRTAAAVLRGLAPWARLLEEPAGAGLLRTGRHDPGGCGTAARGLEGLPVGADYTEHGVTGTVFRTRRPFHPGRLNEALGTVTDAALRTRGHCWIATRPDLALIWESAGGGLSIGAHGPWLAALPDELWPCASPQRRALAAADWNPYYGDRRTELAFVGIELDVAALRRTLAGCLLSDAELSEGAEGWRRFEDPFAGCFGSPVPGEPTS